MKRKSPASLVSKWKQAFSKKEDAITTAAGFSGENGGPQSAGTLGQTSKGGLTLALIKKIPVTFQPTRLENPEDFERMRFVIKACAKEGVGINLFRTVLHVEQTRTGSRLVATDGLRLHVAEISKKIKSGEYKPHVTKDCVSLGEPLEGVRYPAWAKAIPEKTEKRGIINLEKSGMGKDRKATEKLSLTFNSFVKQTGEPAGL